MLPIARSGAFRIASLGFLVVALAPALRAQAPAAARRPLPTQAARDSALVARREALRHHIAVLDSARAERIRVWREQHPDASSPPSTVLVDVTPAGHPVYIGND